MEQSEDPASEASTDASPAVEDANAAAAPAASATAATDSLPTAAVAGEQAPDAGTSSVPGVPAPGVVAAGAPAGDPAAAPSAAATTEPSPDFMRELVTAMRTVAAEARQSGVTTARTQADERVASLEAETERRREELRRRADADVAAVGEWAKAEAERIKREAEARVAARRDQLEQQLSAETARGEAEATAIRDRIAEYERELEAFHAQLVEINDPTAFAAAAKRMPRPPSLSGSAPQPPGEHPADAASKPDETSDAPVASAPTNGTTATNGTARPGTEIHPAEEEVLAARLAELDAALPGTESSAASGTATATPAATTGSTATATEPVTTDVVVKGLGSFGAITSFRQALSGVDGVDAVALSLGQTGEFIFRTTHRPGFDIGAAVIGLEGEAASVEHRGEHGLLVTLDRGR